MSVLRFKSLFAFAALLLGCFSSACAALSDTIPDEVRDAGDRASQVADARESDDASPRDAGDRASQVADARESDDASPRDTDAAKTNDSQRESRSVSAPSIPETDVAESDPNDPVAIGLGEGADISRRFRNRPDRCKRWGKWNEEVAEATQDTGGAAAISGGQSDHNPNEVFSSIFNESMSEQPTARQYLIRVMCGTQIYGIDNWVSEVPLRTYRTKQSHPHVWLSRHLVEPGAESPELETLYRAIIGHSCWAHSNWDADRAYLPYLYCERVAGELPSIDEVAEAFDAYYDGHAYERQNIIHIAKLAHEARDQVVAAFTAAEETHPKLREEIYDRMFAAMAEREAKRDDLAEIYAIVDPITKRLTDSVNHSAPESCLDTLMDARARLAQELFGAPPSSLEEVQELTAGHALGYQITEALAYCLLDEERTSEAFLALDLLESGSRRITEEEVAFLAAYEGVNTVRQSDDGDDALAGYVPVQWHDGFHMIRPDTMATTNALERRLPNRDFFPIVGDSPDEPAVVAELEEVDEGFRVTFEQFSETIEYRERECFETDRVVRFDQRGDSIYPVYERQCHPVGEVKTRTVTHQASPVILPAHEAERIAPGRQIRVRYNRVAGGDDAAVIHMFEPSEERDSGTIINGVTVVL